MGLEIPNVEVRFENLHITADVNIGSRALPTLVNFSRDMLEVNLFNLLNFNFFLLIIIIVMDVVVFCVCSMY